jgi:hypothetical protein
MQASCVSKLHVHLKSNSCLVLLQFNQYPVYLTPSQIEMKSEELLGEFFTENLTNLYTAHRNE